MAIAAKHDCKLINLVRCPKPIEEPDGEVVAFSMRCTVCGREFEEIYLRDEGLFDPINKQTIWLLNE